MASKQEIEEAAAAVREDGGRERVLVHCISSYPAPKEQPICCRFRNWQKILAYCPDSLITQLALPFPLQQSLWVPV